MQLTRYRLLVGLHVQNDPATGKERVYQAGDIIESSLDLCARFNSPGMQGKFERLGEVAQDLYGPLTPEELVKRGITPEVLAWIQAQQGQAPVASPSAPVPASTSPDTPSIVTAPPAAPVSVTANSPTTKAPSPPLTTQSPTSPSAPTPPLTGSDAFDAMTVEELKRFAAEEEIDLRKAKTREDMIKVIRAAT